METIKLLLRKPLYVVLILCINIGAASCTKTKCAANGGGYVDKPKAVNKYKHKPQSGLWGKENKRRR